MPSLMESLCQSEREWKSHMRGTTKGLKVCVKYTCPLSWSGLSVRRAGAVPVAYILTRAGIQWWIGYGCVCLVTYSSGYAMKIKIRRARAMIMIRAYRSGPGKRLVVQYVIALTIRAGWLVVLFVRSSREYSRRSSMSEGMDRRVGPITSQIIK